MRVTVRDNNINQALRTLKRKLQQEGVLKELRSREAYEKPSEQRRREKNEARRRYQKALKKKEALSV